LLRPSSAVFFLQQSSKIDFDPDASPRLGVHTSIAREMPAKILFLRNILESFCRDSEAAGTVAMNVVHEKHKTNSVKARCTRQ
jgi:hypothetical protein